MNDEKKIAVVTLRLSESRLTDLKGLAKAKNMKTSALLCSLIDDLIAKEKAYRDSLNAVFAPTHTLDGDSRVIPCITLGDIDAA